jgi:hypothetical protein
MTGGSLAVESGRELEEQVVKVATKLGLLVRRQVKVGKRIWGADRYIDVVVTERESRQSLGVECKYQGAQGSAEEKIPTTIKDIEAWPIPGIVVIYGEGFSERMRAYLYSTGKVVDLEDLGTWLTLFFSL